MSDEARARLFCPSEGRGGSEFWITDGATIGRDSSNEIVLPFKTLSRREARISFDTQTGAYYLESLGRATATRLDGVVVKGRVRLSDLNVITLGGQDFIFVRVSGETAEHARLPATPGRLEEKLPASGGGTQFARIKKVAVPEFRSRSRRPGVEAAPEGTVAGRRDKIVAPRFRSRSDEAANRDRVEPESPPPAGSALSKPAAPSEASAGQLVLVVELAQGKLEYPLVEGRHVVGRSGECDLRLEDSTVSRRHAVLEVDTGGVTVEDLNSVNYTFLGNHRVTSRVPVAPGSAVRFGTVEAKLVLRGPTHE